MIGLVILNCKVGVINSLRCPLCLKSAFKPANCPEMAHGYRPIWGMSNFKLFHLLQFKYVLNTVSTLKDSAITIIPSDFSPIQFRLSAQITMAFSPGIFPFFNYRQRLSIRCDTVLCLCGGLHAFGSRRVGGVAGGYEWWEPLQEQITGVGVYYQRGRGGINSGLTIRQHYCIMPTLKQIQRETPQLRQVRLILSDCSYWGQ